MKKNILNKNKLPIFIGLITGIFLLNFFSQSIDIKINFEELALGKDNKKSMGVEEGKTIHCSDLRDLKDCSESYKNINYKMPVILWLGNSQLHAINQPKVNDEISSSQLHRKLKNFGMYTLTFSQPNANLQEHYLLFAHLIKKFPIETLVLPLVFDDMREDIIRADIKNILEDLETLESVTKTYTGKNLISLKKKKDTIGNQSKIEKNTFQNQWENYLNRELATIWSLWNKRDLLRSKFFGSLYKLRNSILNINATTTRKMIKGPYVKNQKAYEDILNLANKNKIKVLVYIPPLRSDVKIPYDLNEYKNFKTETKNIANKYNVSFVSLENIIPAEFWGFKGSSSLKKNPELDFMHFKGEGHSLLAEYLFIEIKKIIE